MSNVLDVPEIRAAAVRLTPAQYHRLYEMGVIPEETELLSGILVKQMPKSPLHTWMVIFLQNWLIAIGGVIEVAFHSEAMDRQKAEIYAAAGVQEYWIVLPSRKTIAVYRKPSAGLYLECNEYSMDSPPAPMSAPESVVPARELFAG